MPFGAYGRAALLSFALGVLFLRAFASLPSLPLLAALAAVALGLLLTRFLALGACCLGLAWALLNAEEPAEMPPKVADKLRPSVACNCGWDAVNRIIALEKSLCHCFC